MSRASSRLPSTLATSEPSGSAALPQVGSASWKQTGGAWGWLSDSDIEAAEEWARAGQRETYDSGSESGAPM